MPLNLRPIYHREDGLATVALCKRLEKAYPTAHAAIVYDRDTGDAREVKVVINGYDAGFIRASHGFDAAIQDIEGVERDLSHPQQIRLNAPIARLPNLLLAMERLREICHASANKAFEGFPRGGNGHPQGDRKGVN